MASGPPAPSDAGPDRVALLREAYERRGPVEVRLASNRGQAAIVAERDRAVIALLTSTRQPVLDLLDLGCGDGRVLAALAGRLRLRRAVGVDVLDERIARGRDRRPDLDLRVADGVALPFADESFDAVIALTMFSSVPTATRPAVAGEIARVLRPGGAFVWYDMRRSNPGNRDVRPFDHRDVIRLFPTWSVTTRSLTVAPPLARRLGPITDLAYPLLTRVPLVRTHEAGVAWRPKRPSGA